MSDNNEFTYNLRTRLKDINSDYRDLEKVSRKLQKMINSLYDSGKIKGEQVREVNNHKMNVYHDEYVDLQRKLFDKVLQTEKDYYKNQSNAPKSKARLDEIRKNILEEKYDYNKYYQYKYERINSYQTGRLKRGAYSDRLKRDLNHYSLSHSDSLNQGDTLISQLRGYRQRLDSAMNNKHVSSTFNDDVTDLHDRLFDGGIINDTITTLSSGIAKKQKELDKIEKRNDKNRNYLKNKHASFEGILHGRKAIAEDTKRINDLKKYIEKETELLENIERLQLDITSHYDNYQNMVDNHEINVDPSKYSFRGQLKRYRNRIANRVVFAGVSAFTGDVMEGNNLRIENDDNGITNTMFQLSNLGVNNHHEDNHIQSELDNLGIENGTHMKGSDLSVLLGSYVKSNRTGDIKDYQKQIDEASKYATFTGSGVDATADLMRTIGMVGGTNPRSNLMTMYGSLVNSDTINRATEQTQAMQSMLSYNAKIGNMNTDEINQTIDVQGEMAKTHSSSMQGQQGANAYTAVQSVVTNPRSRIMRNIYAKIHHLNPADMEQNSKLVYEMEQDRKSPKMVAKGIKSLTHYFGDNKEATAEYLMQQSGGKLSATQALKLVKLADSGKLTKKDLEKDTKHNKDTEFDKTTGGKLMKAIQGSGNFTINLYLAVGQKNANRASEMLDPMRNLKGTLFQNHPLLKELSDMGLAMAGNIIPAFIGSFFTNKINDYFENRHNNKKPPRNGGNGGTHESSVNEEESVKEEETVKATREAENVEKESSHFHFNFHGKGKFFAGALLVSGSTYAGYKLLDSHDNDAHADTVSSRKESESKSKETSQDVINKHTEKQEKELLNGFDEYLVKGIHVVDNAKTIHNIIKKPKKSGGGNEDLSISGIGGQGKELIKSIAQKIGQATGIDPKLIFAQLMQETGGNVTGEVAKKDHNLSGLKYVNSMGNSRYGVSVSRGSAATDDGGNYIHFNSYDDYATYYANWLQSSFPDLKSAKNADDYARILKEHGYYTAPESQYAAGMNRWIKEYAYGGLYNNHKRHSMIDDEYLKYSVKSYTGRQYNSAFNSASYDLLNLSVKTHQAEQAHQRPIETNCNVSPEYNVTMSIKHKENYKLYQQAVESVLSEFTDNLTNVVDNVY